MSEVDWFVCDLDLTLYPRASSLMLALDRRFTEEIARRLHLSVAEADGLRCQYYQAYGSTVAGLVRHHRIESLGILDRSHRAMWRRCATRCHRPAVRPAGITGTGNVHGVV